ncbi:uncharacterized protein LOC108266115 [Ictalurus punctatus]|uniref:Uncharacterized protein LOC108266115 n=1 Tax=Ictalurus punctatus TaxID=7998 RepID=A0A9F7RLR6_ICTPU|nr:uncharacterized protein LOC108266115 [Ictalurus punctatus]
MLRQVVDDKGRNWDLLLPYVLFSVRECPQASMGFTPFDILFGWRPRGLLDVAREAWEEQPSPFCSVINFVQEMQEKIDRVAPIVQEHMRAAQEEQKRVYNRTAQPEEFQPGDRVLLLVPNSTYTDHNEGVLVQQGEDLTTTQRQELTELVGQFTDFFSTSPGTKQLVHHKFKTRNIPASDRHCPATPSPLHTHPHGLKINSTCLTLDTVLCPPLARFPKQIFASCSVSVPFLVLISLIPVAHAQGRPKAVVSITPDTHVFIGETVTLRCEVQGGGNTQWTYSWYKNNRLTDRTVQEIRTVSAEYGHHGDFTCRGQSSDSQSSEISDAVTLTVSEDPQVVLSVSPQSWLTEGDSVTLNCEVTNSSTDWTFSWYTIYPYRIKRDHCGDIVYGDSYTISPAALKHTGVYMCSADGGERVYRTYDSNKQPLWITGESPPVSLIINPNRTQHFTDDFLSLSCEDQSNSTGWRVRQYTDSGRVLDCSQWGSVTGSTCKISFLSTSYTRVHWCESESGEISNPVNITVHDGGVILESPVHPVTEGHPLTLRCLYRYTNSSNLRADFYKDGSVLQTQTTGEMIIRTVSKSDEGFYHCKHPERGESPKSWVSVRSSDPSGVEAPFSVLMLISSVVTASPYLLVTIILLVKCYRARAHTDAYRIQNAVIEE